MPEPPAGGWTWDEFARDRQAADRQGQGHVRHRAGRRSATRTPCGASGRSCGRRGGDIITRTARPASAARPASRRSTSSTGSRRTTRSTSTPSPTATRPTSCSTTARSAMVVTGPWQLPDFIEAKVDFGVVPLPTFGGEPVTISGAGHVDAVRQRQARARRPRDRVRPVAQLSPSRTRAGSVEAGLAAAAQGHRASSRSGRRTRTRRPGLSVFVDALDGARTKPTDPLYPQVSEAGRAVARRGAAQALLAAGRAQQGGPGRSDAVLAGGG